MQARVIAFPHLRCSHPCYNIRERERSASHCGEQNDQYSENLDQGMWVKALESVKNSDVRELEALSHRQVVEN